MGAIETTLQFFIVLNKYTFLNQLCGKHFEKIEKSSDGKTNILLLDIRPRYGDC